jgi:hypothetical protein
MAEEHQPLPRTLPWSVLAERLPALLEAQFAAYRRLLQADSGEDEGPREVTAWENARKAALAHLQSLIRVHDLVQAHLAQHPDGDSVDLSLLLAEVRQDLAEADDPPEGEAG